MKNSHRFLVLPLALAAGALANQPGILANTTMTPGDSVNVLRTVLRSDAGFELDHAHMTEDGIACIAYRVHSDRGASRALAVVQGGKVLLSTSRSRSFARAWNTNCAGAARQVSNP